MNRNKQYPLKHISVRVPWHDNQWNGTICSNPQQNGSCLILKNCALNRDDTQEEKNKGKSIKFLERENFPSCISERGTFMADFSFNKYANHPYSKSNKDTHGHFIETAIRFPSYSLASVPFRWMMKKFKDIPNHAELTAEKYEFDFNIKREPQLNFPDNWIQEAGNQRAILNCFFEHLEPENSLCFIYAKQVPFVETSGRVLVGVGRVKHISDGVEYNKSAQGGLSSMMWEHLVQHSIRPDYQDGFLLPYHEALEYSKKNPEFDPAELAVIVPSELMMEFSYATEHVSSSSAIRVLLECHKSLEKAKELGIGKNIDQCLKWIHQRINELEKLRGYYPGLGSVLTGYGIEQGHFIAQELIEKSGENGNPWTLFEDMLKEPKKYLSKKLAVNITKMIALQWEKLKKDNPKKIEFFQLLSRFDLSIEQVEMVLEKVDNGEFSEASDFLQNPYLLYEETLRTELPIDLWNIDYGLFINLKSDDIVLPESIDIERDCPERIRAFTTYILEIEAQNGHTLLPRQKIINDITNLSLKPTLEPNNDIFEIAEEIFENCIYKVEMEDNSVAYQLERLYQTSNLISNKVKKLKSASRYEINVNWTELLNNELGDYDSSDEEEYKAREEKSQALKELADSPFSVLIGSAGTGKTTLISILCNQNEIKRGGILLLAPTGKSKVIMANKVRGKNIKAYTIAEFLNRHKRYDGNTRTYHITGEQGENGFETIIVDESSMLTEEMLAALFDCITSFKRFILVGDHRQLPPIGPGRPFFDIVDYIKPENIENIFPEVSNCYSKLTIRRRQKEDKEQRFDLAFADLFNGEINHPGDDEIFNKVINEENLENIKFIQWDNEVDFKIKFNNTLKEELELNFSDEQKNTYKFNQTLGAEKLHFLNANKVDNWQILSPIKEKAFGVNNLNRVIHKAYRSNFINKIRKAHDYFSYDSELVKKYAKPVGTQEIVYGDKIINLSNNWRFDIDDKRSYIANGEIGIVIKNNDDSEKQKHIEVEFNSQPGKIYKFSEKDFSEEGNSALELAYALTVHKSQGSEFNTVFLVIPNPCFLLTREMLYTALTRQKQKVIVFYQGEPSTLKKYCYDKYSETIRRMTNLFYPPKFRIIGNRYFEERLIHCASDGEMLRSKSEIIIYEKLLAYGLNPKYEKQLIINGRIYSPDFTISYANKTIYWEHCGMLGDKKYKRDWEDKKNWYINNGIKPFQEGGGSKGILVESADSLDGGISIPEINEIINDVFPDIQMIQDEINWKKIISKGESEIIEFKESMRWSFIEKKDKLSEYIIAKTIAAFLNSNGGTLFIGVKDDGGISGIEQDYRTLTKRPNSDGFKQNLVNVINNYLGKEYSKYLTILIEKVDEKDICIIKVSKSNTGAILKNNAKEEFFIRSSNTTQELNMSEAMNYINKHFSRT